MLNCRIAYCCLAAYASTGDWLCLNYTVVSRLTLRPETGLVELSYSLLMSRGLRFDRRLAMFIAQSLSITA